MADTAWWQHGTIYQIYPRSLQDTNGDGVGDLPGICSRLDYLADLGVDAIWVSPFFPSPMADFGYDVADYCGVDALFGTMADFDRLLSETHKRGMKLILDFVPNHSSIEHRWFQESRASRNNPRRDWYIWKDPAPDGGPPNNWLANFGGPAWTLDEPTGQYYYHAFLPEQPDLNWRNPQVRAAMFDNMRFWLDKGVDGFRVDVIWHLMKDPQFRDNPPNPAWKPGQPEINRNLQIHSADHPDIHKVVAEMRDVLEAYGERVLIGEIYLPVERLVDYYGRNLEGAHLPFNFQLIQAAWNAKEIARIIREYEGALPKGGWPNWVLSNHDQPRIASRIGSDQAPLAAMLLLTLRGTPTLYYGDELGIENVPVPPDRVQDPWEKREPGLQCGRDPYRSPMPWTGEAPHAGFSPAEPWLPLNPDWKSRNVAAQSADPASLLNLYRHLLALRRAEPALHEGDWVHVHTEGEVLAYERRHAGRRLFVALNFAPERQEVALPGDGIEGAVLVSTRHGRDGERASRMLDLEAAEGVIVALDPVSPGS